MKRLALSKSNLPPAGGSSSVTLPTCIGEPGVSM
jgi:hypothetical protein